MSKKEDLIKSQVRIPSELHAQIQASAEVTGRSMNAEIIHRLECSFENSKMLEVVIQADRSLKINELEFAINSIESYVSSPDQPISVTINHI